MFACFLVNNKPIQLQLFLNGCKKLTERTYHYFTAVDTEDATCKPVQQLQMIGTSVSALPTSMIVNLYQKCKKAKS